MSYTSMIFDYMDAGYTFEEACEKVKSIRESNEQRSRGKIRRNLEEGSKRRQ